MSLDLFDICFLYNCKIDELFLNATIGGALCNCGYFSISGGGKVKDFLMNDLC